MKRIFNAVDLFVPLEQLIVMKFLKRNSVPWNTVLMIVLRLNGETSSRALESKTFKATMDRMVRVQCPLWIIGQEVPIPFVYSVRQGGH